MDITLNILYRLQDGLNSDIVADWKNVRTNDEFQTECLLEIAELMECIPFRKWWKHYSGEQVNILREKSKLEMVDILHFALSGAILKKYEKISCKQYILSVVEGFLYSVPAYNLRDTDIEKYKSLIHLTMGNNYEEIIRRLFILAKELKFNIFGYYIAKYTLNKIRLIKGYKTGEYKKTNKGREDNEILLEYIPKSMNNMNRLELEIYEIMIENIYIAFGIPPEHRFKLKNFYI